MFDCTTLSSIHNAQCSGQHPTSSTHEWKNDDCKHDIPKYPVYRQQAGEIVRVLRSPSDELTSKSHQSIVPRCLRHLVYVFIGHPEVVFVPKAVKSSLPLDNALGEKRELSRNP